MSMFVGNRTYICNELDTSFWMGDSVKTKKINTIHLMIAAKTIYMWDIEVYHDRFRFMSLKCQGFYYCFTLIHLIKKFVKYLF